VNFQRAACISSRGNEKFDCESVCLRPGIAQTLHSSRLSATPGVSLVAMDQGWTRRWTARYSSPPRDRWSVGRAYDVASDSTSREIDSFRLFAYRSAHRHEALQYPGRAGAPRARSLRYHFSAPTHRHSDRDGDASADTTISTPRPTGAFPTDSGTGGSSKLLQ